MPATGDLGLDGASGTVRFGSARRWLRSNGELLAPIVIGLLVFGVASGVLAWATHDRPVLRVQMAFGSKACCTWQIWIGGPKGDGTVLPVASGQSTIYSVPVYRTNVTQLYITTGSQPGGRTQIERIWLTRGGQTVSEVTATQLKSATVYQATGRQTAAGLELSSTGSQPAINLPVSLDTHEGFLRTFLARLVSQRLLAVGAIIVIGSVLLSFFGAHKRRRGLTLCAAVVATLVAVRGTPWLSWRIHFHDDVSHAVGYATYVGLWKGRERFVLEAACALAVVVAALLGFAYRRFWTSSEQSDEVGYLQPADRPLPRWVAPLAVAVPVSLVALAAVPDLRRYIGPAPQHVASWDANNLIFWRYLIQTTHLAPMKDFFWPYGFQWVFDKPDPWGLLATFGWFLTFWVFLAIGTWISLSRFFGGRSLLLRYGVLAGLWLTVALTSDVPFQTRYIAPLAAVLLFAGIDGRDRWWSWKRLLFALALLSAALFEPAQAIYATVPILVLAGLGFAADELRYRGHRRAWAGRTSATIAAPLVAAALVYVAAGAAHATVTFYKAEAVSSSAYAFPTAIDLWVTGQATLEALIFWSVPLTLAIGTAGLLLRRGVLRQSYAVVVALGVLGFMIMQKQILRPHIATQAWFALLFGLAYWAVTDTILAPRRRWPFVLAFGGVAAALALVSGGYRTGWNAVENGPPHVEGTIHELIHGRKTFARQAKEQFTPATFANFSDSWPVVHALQRVPRVAQGGPVWILGDEPPLTMMLGQSWPYYYNDMYDASPIDFQKEILARLKRTPPARVVWNFRPAALIFDEVPMPVRVPLLYDWAVRNLTPERRVGHFEILRGRRSSEPIALAWWRRRLGRTIDLGHIPAVAKLSGEPCSSGPNCGTFLIIRYGPGTPKPPETIPVRVAGLPFDVSFEPGLESSYMIPLDRVWFWSAATGKPRSVLARTTPGGPQIDVVHRTIDDNVLY